MFLIIFSYPLLRLFSYYIHTLSLFLTLSIPLSILLSNSSLPCIFSILYSILCSIFPLLYIFSILTLSLLKCLNIMFSSGPNSHISFHTLREQLPTTIIGHAHPVLLFSLKIPRRSLIFLLLLNPLHIPYSKPLTGHL